MKDSVHRINLFQTAQFCETWLLSFTSSSEQKFWRKNVVWKVLNIPASLVPLMEGGVGGATGMKQQLMHYS